MKRAITGLILVAGVLAAAEVSHAVDAEAGTAASNISTLLDGARPAGMGGAFTAVSDDINAMYHNPAGLGFFRASEFSANQYGGVSDFKLSEIALAIPLGDVTASNVRQLGTIALSLATMDYGTEEATDDTGDGIGRLNAHDRSTGVGWGKALNERVAIGFMGRVYETKIFKEGEEDTLVNAGLLLKAVPDRMHIGAAASHLGGSDSPTEYRGGLAFMPSKVILLAVDAGVAEDRSSIVRAGIEIRPVSAVALRAGYDSAFDAGSGISFGAGVQLLDFEVGFFPLEKVGLDYSITPTDDLDTVHRVSLSARIGTQ